MNQQKENPFPIIPQPLLNSQMEFGKILSKYQKYLKENAAEYRMRHFEATALPESDKAPHVSLPHNLPAGSFPLPCLVGESANKIAKYTERIFWAEGGDPVLSSCMDPHDIPWHSPQQNLLEAIHFCPIAIFRPADKPFGYTTKLWIYLYQVFRSVEAPADDPDAFPKMKIKPLCIYYVSSLQSQDLKKAIEYFHSQNLTIAHLRALLIRQAYLLYGVVPSFLLLRKPLKIASPLDFLFDSEITISLHPSVANWWTCALHQQVEFLASEKGKQQSFPGQVSSDSDMNTDYFLESWETNVKKLYWKSSARVETFRTRLFFPYNPKYPLNVPSDFQHSNQLLGFTNHSLLGPKYYSIALWTQAGFTDPILQPVELLLRPFYQRQHHNGFLKEDLYKACHSWLSYAAANVSRTYFLSALLAAAYSAMSPEVSLDKLPSIKLLDVLPDCVSLVATDPETLSPESDHPLLTSQLLWSVFHVPSKATMSSIFAKLRKAQRQLCILIFDGPCRTLTQLEYAHLLCYGKPLLIVNAVLPEGFRIIPVKLRDLGRWTDIPPATTAPAGGEDYFPSSESFYILCMIADRVINRLAWVQANRTMLRAHLTMESKFRNLCVFSENVHVSRDFLRYFRNSLERHKNPSCKALAYIDERIIFKKFCSCCSVSSLRPYMPQLRFLSLLGISAMVLNDKDPDHLFEITVNRLLPQDLYTSFEFFYPLLPLRKNMAKDAFKGIWGKFLVFLSDLRQKKPPYFCQSKEEYLLCLQKDSQPLGWESDGRFYLTYDLYWDAFLANHPYRNLLATKQNQFQRQYLAPKAGSLLHRDDIKSGRWYCRFTATENGKSVRIGKFLVLDCSILTPK